MVKKNFFKVLHFSKKSKARLGEINTAHGAIKTPAFVPVGTKGSIKSLTSQLIKDIGVQVAFVNTYHLVTHPGAEIIEKAGGIHKFANLNIPLMSDSGGFQIFSLARQREDNDQYPISPPAIAQGSGNWRAGNIQTNFKFQTTNFQKNESIGVLYPSSFKLQQMTSGINPSNPLLQLKSVANWNKMGIATQHKGESPPAVIKISEDGVKFRSTFDGTLLEFTPEKSMEFQKMIGADLNMAFDECTYYGCTRSYAISAMERTHEWLKRCIKYKKNFQYFKNLNIKNSLKIKNFKLKINQYLYGIIQGGVYEDLRKKSAQFVTSQAIDGVAIGGVSVGETKKEMREQVKWVSDYLPKDKPVHLLGVGQIDDIVDLVKHGIDSFDCVEPTRLARMGNIYQVRYQNFLLFPSPIGEIDIFKGIYRNNLEPVDKSCNCYVCCNFTKAYLHHLFKQKELLGYTLATFHNLWVMERLFDKIRESINNNLI